jgi:hypothetical protein
LLAQPTIIIMQAASTTPIHFPCMIESSSSVKR